ncbi:MAG: M50 family metallopeptidase [Pseudomonadota bacterium]|nr:M50 family metallopeptidase [Pseudomonadota bacterium]MEC8262272.1 M50 family metallopeptidase [Pseudomonadota bacterium]
MPELSAFQLIVGFLLLLTPVVFFHELGHYWVARRAGVVVEVFSVGFGPEIYGWTSGKTGTRWRIAAIPLGGYVRMRGDENEASGAAPDAEKVPGSFAGASLGWRSAIVLAGPVANFILGILLFALVYMTVGKVTIPAEIGQVMPETAAAEAGLQPGDLVTDIDGITVRDFSDLRGLVVEAPGRPLEFTILRDGRPVTLTVTPQPRFNEEMQVYIGLLGVKSSGGGMRERLLPGSALVAASSDAFRMSVMILRGLARLGRGEMQAGEVQGPVGIAKISGSALQQGLIPFVLLTAVISINLGLINLLPIPALDGGHLSFFLYEALFRRPIPLIVQGILLRGGISILLALTVVLVVFDVARLFN